MSGNRFFNMKMCELSQRQCDAATWARDTQKMLEQTEMWQICDEMQN